MRTKERLQRIIERLQEVFIPDAHTETGFRKPRFSCLVATILSAQCTDKRVNIVTQDLFSKISDRPRIGGGQPRGIGGGDQNDWVSFVTKQRIFGAMAKDLVEKYKGQGPTVDGGIDAIGWGGPKDRKCGFGECLFARRRNRCRYTRGSIGQTF